MMGDVVVVDGLGKDFGTLTAVASVDFTVRRQEILGLCAVVLATVAAVRFNRAD
jgi:ABC-type branched-subunit amino acid transport system ATPase component